MNIFKQNENESAFRTALKKLKQLKNNLQYIKAKSSILAGADILDYIFSDNNSVCLILFDLYGKKSWELKIRRKGEELIKLDNNNILTIAENNNYSPEYSPEEIKNIIDNIIGEQEEHKRIFGNTKQQTNTKLKDFIKLFGNKNDK